MQININDKRVLIFKEIISLIVKNCYYCFRIVLFCVKMKIFQKPSHVSINGSGHSA